jgi:hypothetical protein
MPTRVTLATLLVAILPLVATPACQSTPAPTPPSSPSSPPTSEYHHELHLPPAGPQVSVALDGKRVDVALADVPHEGAAASLIQVWKVAFPTEDPTPLHFDLTGSDGFHPASRPVCARPLTGAEIVAARIDVATHDVSFEDAVKLPGCYRVKGVVRIDASR